MAEKNIKPTDPDTKVADEVEDESKTEAERKTAGASGRFRKTANFRV